MKTIVTGPLVHKCPYEDDDIDLGTVRLEWDGPAPELHGVADFLAGFAERTVTHEVATQLIASELNARVTTTWVTAGLEVIVEAEPPR